MQPMNKKDLVGSMLDQGLIHILVDTRTPGVDLPEHLMGRVDVKINLSWQFKTLIELTDQGIFANLSFNGETRQVVIPWFAIYFVGSKQTQEGILFPEDAPGEIVTRITSSQESRPKPQKFESIDGGNEVSPPRTGHLRVLH